MNKKFPRARITYYGINFLSKEEVAVKREEKNSNLNKIFFESEIYESLQGEMGVPKLLWVGTKDNYDILVRELLDKSLYDYHIECNYKFSLSTTITLVDQMISLIETYHKKNYVFSNIKPSQFLMGRGKMKNKVYIIPSKYSKKYIDPKTGLHIPYKKGVVSGGTALYCSINLHKKIEISRRDDIEALGYVLVYFLKGNLPWSEEATTQALEEVLKLKINTSLNDLCEGCPEEVMTFIQYARNLKFKETPNYNYLRGLLRKIIRKNNLVINYKYDWLALEK